jgi:hypothetical protein
MRATKDTAAGRRYLNLQREARRTSRPTDELIQLYALECFLDRLTRSEFAENFVLKGGVLLAALDARRPTRDIDFAARAIDNDTNAVTNGLDLPDENSVRNAERISWVAGARDGVAGVQVGERQKDLGKRAAELLGQISETADPAAASPLYRRHCLSTPIMQIKSI